MSSGNGEQAKWLVCCDVCTKLVVSTPQQTSMCGFDRQEHPIDMWISNDGSSRESTCGWMARRTVAFRAHKRSNYRFNTSILIKRRNYEMQGLTWVKSGVNNHGYFFICIQETKTYVEIFT
jgi:hypothetical protein